MLLGTGMRQPPLDQTWASLDLVPDLCSWKRVWGPMAQEDPAFGDLAVDESTAIAVRCKDATRSSKRPLFEYLTDRSLTDRVFH